MKQGVILQKLILKFRVLYNTLDFLKTNLKRNFLD